MRVSSVLANGVGDDSLANEPLAATAAVAQLRIWCCGEMAS
jgi:hypothetical protein